MLMTWATCLGFQTLRKKTLTTLDVKMTDTEQLGLQKTLDRKRDQLEGVAHKSGAKSWLFPCARSEEGTDQLLEALEKRVECDDFENMLTEERRLFDLDQPTEVSSSATGSAQQPSQNSNSSTIGNEVLNPDWWEPVTGPLGADTIPEDTGDYIVVEHADVIDALANFLAAYIVSLPESRGMQPKELQKAVRQSLKEIRKGKIRKLWDWGRFLYRAAAMSYGAFAAYTNPWLAEAVLKAVFTCARFATKFW